jgi:VWFA-related protein
MCNSFLSGADCTPRYPEAMRVLAAVCVSLISLTAAAQYEESITVARVLADVRVTRYGGQPIAGLTPADFTVRIGGKEAVVRSVTWRGADGTSSTASLEEEGDLPLTDDAAEAEDAVEDDQPYEPPAGRLFVVFVQTDFARNRARVTGQMKFGRYAEEIIAGLAPEDRVAVFSFDSHLKFRQDFTTDKEAVQAAMRDSIRIDDPPLPPVVAEPSLRSRLDPQAMRRAASSEAALLIVAKALRGIDGPKTLILLGWGLGQRVGNAVEMTRQWPAAQAALLDARVTIYALDTTAASGHDLAIGLSAAAGATGGFYASTYDLPQIAVNRLRESLTGYYELEIDVPEGTKPGTRALEVKVKPSGALVMAQPTVLIRE